MYRNRGGACCAGSACGSSSNASVTRISARPIKASVASGVKRAVANEPIGYFAAVPPSAPRRKSRTTRRITWPAPSMDPGEQVTAPLPAATTLDIEIQVIGPAEAATREAHRHERGVLTRAEPDAGHRIDPSRRRDGGLPNRLDAPHRTIANAAGRLEARRGP